MNHPADALPLPEPFMAMCRDTVPHIYDAWANQLRAAHREGFELAIQQAQPTPALKRHALEAADQLSKYAAAPFFPDTDKRGVTRSTTTEWWDGLAELIEEAQPLIVRALRECTEPHDKQQQAGSVMLTDAEKLLPHGYLLAKVAMVLPLLEEARDALTAITEHQRRLHGISPTLADRMDVAGTYSLEDWQATAGGVA